MALWNRQKKGISAGMASIATPFSAVHDMNKQHATTILYGKGRKKVKKLLERYTVFSWLINIPGITCNHFGK
ncbi:UNVERIFIED_CONTAM: hypothetical protein Sradi_0718500 [Sesamum radiatum]|uniref:Uncharacterized protein n=1 Tax=Sesamum radiatum TaxID=300843 RepID=A0AAW2VQ67_SESRA